METKTQDTESKIQVKREFLKDLSKALKPLVENGDFAKINDAIEAHYRVENPEITEFKTFNDWRNEGKKVKRGEKAFVIWGRKREASKKEDKKESTEETQGYNFFPVCHLFANTQVS